MSEQAPRGLPELLDTKQVASYLKLHEVTVLAFAREGKLPGFKVGREWRFRADDIKGWMEQREQGEDAFAQRFDQLWERLRQRAERASYGAEDIPRLVREVREAKSMRRTASGA